MRKIEILIKDTDRAISIDMKGYEDRKTNLREESAQNVLIDLVDKFLKDSRSNDMISAEYMKLKLEKELKRRKNK